MTYVSECCGADLGCVMDCETSDKAWVCKACLREPATRTTPADLAAHVKNLKTENALLQVAFTRLDTLINSPHVDDFLNNVRTEAAHQLERWGEDHDLNKSPTEWYWLCAYLGGKAIAATDREKRLHRIIAMAAACLNWHRREATKKELK